jgi:predicted SAM-dependent methyltransferase
MMPVLMPIWRRVWARVERRVVVVEARTASVEANLVPMEARLAALEAAWRQHVPSFLNAVGTVAAFAHEITHLRHELAAQPERMQAALDAARQAAERKLREFAEEMGRLRHETASHTVMRAEHAARMDSLAGRLEQDGLRIDNIDASIQSIWERIEFVRREMLFEMQHGGGGGLPSDAAPVQPPRIAAVEKVAAARAAGALRLNLGCGHIALPGYVNVDMRELPGVDVIAEAGYLPFEPDSVDEIHSAHLLEHFPQEAIRRRLLPYWHSLLRPGGIFRAVTPDAAAMLPAVADGSYSFDDFREVVFGAQDYAGDYHYNLFTPDSLRGLLAEVGFSDIEVPVAGRRNGKCFEFEIAARRP